MDWSIPIHFFIQNLNNFLLEIVKSSITYMLNEMNILFNTVITTPFCFHIVKCDEIINKNINMDDVNKFFSVHSKKFSSFINNLQQFSSGCYDIDITTKPIISPRIKEITNWFTVEDNDEFWSKN